MPTPWHWRDAAYVGGLVAVFWLVATLRLIDPNMPVFDEVYHVRTAVQYLQGQEIYEWTHPPLAKLLMAVGIALGHGQFDLDSQVITWNAVTWRAVSVLFAGVALTGCYVLARLLFERRAVAVGATALLAVDTCFFVHARAGMTNVYSIAFLLWALVGLWWVLRADRGWWLAGLGFGLALATRWTAVYAEILALGLIAWQVWTVKRHAWNARIDPQADTDEARLASLWRNIDKRAVGAFALKFGLAFGALPLAVYLASYLPNVLQGPGPWWAHVFAWNYNQHGWGWVFELQGRMLGYHAMLDSPHAYYSPWWSWPWMARPVWYFFTVLQPGGALLGVWAIGNALIWWASVPALAWAAWRGLKHQEHALGFVALFGLGLWGFWAIQPRHGLYMHYFLDSIPFACMAIAVIAARAWSSGRLARLGVAAYGLAAIAWFCWYYPLATAVPITKPFLDWHLIFGAAWI